MLQAEPAKKSCHKRSLFSRSAARVDGVGGPDTRLLATVHLYLHPSSVDTKYMGTMRVEFLNGSAAEAHDTMIDSTVKPGGSTVNVSVTGQVTSKPGTYASHNRTRGDVDGRQKVPTRYRETVSVVVK